MLNWVRTWIELFKIDVEWGKDMEIDFEIRYFCARSAPEYFGILKKYWIRLLGEMLDVEWTKDMNRKFAKKLGHEIENGNSTSNIPLLPYLSTLCHIIILAKCVTACGVKGGTQHCARPACPWPRPLLNCSPA